jgi:hypothetical protein
MRFMLTVMAENANEEQWEPTPEIVEAMMEYNRQLSDAGVLLALDGLRPLTDGARVEHRGGKSVVTDGPFTEAKEIVGGYWIIQARDKEEAVEWATRIPLGEGGAVEVRRIAEMEDFSDEVQAVDVSGIEPKAQPTEE